MTCAEMQRSISDALDGDPARGHDDHLLSCAECRRFEDVSIDVADAYRESVLVSHRALRRLDAPRPRRRPALALAAAILLALFTVPAVSPPAPPPATAPLAIVIPDLPASLRSELDVDLLALARDLPIRLGDPWPAEQLLPRSVAE